MCVKFVVDESLKTGELERELLVTYDPAVIKELVPKLASKVGNNQTVYLTDKVGPYFHLIVVFLCAKKTRFSIKWSFILSSLSSISRRWTIRTSVFCA